MKLLAIPFALTLLAVTATACLEFKMDDFGQDSLGGNLKLDGLEICYLSYQTPWEGVPTSHGGAGETRPFKCIQPWLHAWQPRPRDGDMIIAYKNDLQGGSLGKMEPREFTIGKVDLREQIGGGKGGLEINPWQAKLEC